MTGESGRYDGGGTGGPFAWPPVLGAASALAFLAIPALYADRLLALFKSVELALPQPTAVLLARKDLVMSITGAVLVLNVVAFFGPRGAAVGLSIVTTAAAWLAANILFTPAFHLHLTVDAEGGPLELLPLALAIATPICLALFIWLGRRGSLFALALFAFAAPLATAQLTIFLAETLIQQAPK